MSVSLVARTGAVALAGLAAAGVVLAAPAEAATTVTSKPISVSGTLLPNQTKVVSTFAPTASVCLSLVLPGNSARVLIRPRVGLPITVTVASTVRWCVSVRPQGSITLHNYGPAKVRYTVSSSVFG